jgi:uncharacterized protein YbjT (DUF2867 family)
MKTALVIGATGLVGSQLVQLLLKDKRFDKVKIFVRRSVGIECDKLEEYIVNFDETDKWKRLLTGDILYSAMGTTLRTAGSKNVQYKIDYTYQYQVAKAAAANDVKEYILISAAGASPDSKIFYSRMKGELERDIRKLPFEAIHIIRPGMLSGERLEVRTGEKVAISIMNALSSIPGLRKLKPIEGIEVAKAMVNATFRYSAGIHSYTMGEVSKLAQPALL